MPSPSFARLSNRQSEENGSFTAVPDPAKQLQTIYLAGFDIHTFERFPNTVGLCKGHCIALVQPTSSGLRLLGQPGWHMGEVLGVLVERNGKRMFQAKSEYLEATPERLNELQDFRRELENLMSPRA
jgi:hypothetical protein